MTEPKKRNVPRLRFPEFREKGEWSSRPMGEVYSYKGNNSLSREKLNYENGLIKNIHYGDIHTKFSTLFDITKEAVPYINASEPQDSFRSGNFCVEGDMVFADASEDLEGIGKSIEIVKLNGERVVSGLHTILARQSAATLVTGFAGYLFKSHVIRKQIQKESQGAKVLGISGGRLSKITIPFPSDKAEQQKIADCLASLDELIGLEAQKLAALKAHKKGLMQQLFPAEGETLPKLRFPEFRNAGEWEEMTLGDIAKITSGGTPNRAKPDYWQGDIPWITTSLIDFNIIYESDEFITTEGLNNSSAKLFQAQTLLMAMYGQGKTRGKVALLGIEAATNQACAAIMPNKNFDTNFVFQNLASRYDEIRKLSNEGGQENLSAGLIKEIPLIHPSLPEQQKIASCLSSLDEFITAQTQQIEALKTHKKGLMQQLFPSRVGRATAFCCPTKTELEPPDRHESSHKLA